MPHSLSAGDRDADAPVAAILRLLAERRPNGLALLVSGADDIAVIEDAWPAPPAAGRGVPVPRGLLAAAPVALPLEGTRLSLAWTEMAGARPTHLSAVPVPGQPLHLVVAGTGAGADDPALLSATAGVVGQLLARGRTTRRDRDESRRVAALVDNFAVPLVFVDSRTVEVFLNDRARRLLDVADGSDADVAAALSRLVADAGDENRARFAADPTVSLSFEILHHATCFAVRSRWIDEERLTGRLWVFRDITDDRQVARLKDELVSTVSHELRTPLTSIIGALTLVKERRMGDLPAPAAGLVDVAYRNGLRLMRLVDDLLDLDRLQAGKFDYRFRRLDLCGLLRESLDQNRPYADRHDVTLELDAPPLPIIATLDGDRIAQVMSNLLSNAIKFSPPRAAVIVRVLAAGDAVRISVIDRGPGISPAFRERLFTRFAQEHAQAQHGAEGSSGLGLAISKTIVTQHGGAISADPHVATGATFHVDLPLRRA